MGYMEDTLKWWEDRDEKFAKELPHCSVCGEPIYDDYTYILDEEYYCEECWEEFSGDCRVSTDSLMVS